MKSNRFFFVLTAAFCLVAGTVKAKPNLNELVNAYMEEWAGWRIWGSAWKMRPAPTSALWCMFMTGARTRSWNLRCYFLGFHGFRTLWAEENRRLGKNFKTREFVDKVLRTGPMMPSLQQLNKKYRITF